MSKKQVFGVSLVAAVPAIALLVVLVLNALSHGGEMFSGAMTVFVGLAALLCLFGVGAMPVYILAFYPAEGFLPTVPPPQTGGSQSRPADDDEDDDEEMAADDDDEFEDDGFEDDGFEDDGDDGFEDDFEDDGFEDEGFDDDFDDDEWS